MVGAVSMGFEGAVALSGALHGNGTLRQLILDSNAINAGGGEALMRALGGNSGLELLSLADNPIGVDRGEGHGAIQELAGSLQLNNTLATIDLRQCRVSRKGALALCSVIESSGHSASMVNLRLKGNPDIDQHLALRLKDAAKPPLLIDIDTWD